MVCSCCPATSSLAAASLQDLGLRNAMIGQTLARRYRSTAMAAPDATTNATPTMSLSFGSGDQSFTIVRRSESRLRAR